MRRLAAAFQNAQTLAVVGDWTAWAATFQPLANDVPEKRPDIPFIHTHRTDSIQAAIIVLSPTASNAF